MSKPLQTVPVQTVTVRPFRRLMWQAAIAVAMLCTPIFIAWLLLTVPNGTWLPVPLTAAGVLLVCVIALVMFLRVHITVSPDGLVERTIWGRTISVPATSITRVLMLEMHRSMTSDSRLQLFVLNDTDEALMRMRGEFWERADIERVASSVPAHIDRTSKPVTLTELQQNSPAMLYWFERAPLRR